MKYFVRRGTTNIAAQGLGNLLVTHNAWQVVNSSNYLLAATSGFKVPLGHNSLFSAGFGYGRKKSFKSIVTGDMSAYEFGRAATFSYACSKVAAGFKVEGQPGRKRPPWGEKYRPSARLTKAP